MNRVMREVRPMSADTPDFPTASGVLAPLKAKAESQNSADFSSLWAGQTAALGEVLGAKDLTQKLAADGLARLTTPN